MHVHYLHFLELILSLNCLNTVHTVCIGLQENIIYYSMLYRAVFTENACFITQYYTVHCEFYTAYRKYLYILTFHMYVLLIM